MRRLTPIALAAAVLVLAGMQCNWDVSWIENKTGAPLHVEVVCQDEWTFVGELTDHLVIGTSRGTHRLERLGIQRPDGAVQRYDRARLELLAKDIVDHDGIVWVIDGAGLRALSLDAWVEERKRR